jgi:hypothetical protein
MEIQKRQEDRLDKEAGLRNELATLQLNQTRANIEKGARREQIMAGLPERLKVIPEGENRFSVAHNYFMEQGETDLAMEYQKMQGDKIEQLWKMDKYAASKLYNDTLGKVTGVSVNPVPGKDDLVETITKDGRRQYLLKTAGGFEPYNGIPEGSTIAVKKENLPEKARLFEYYRSNGGKMGMDEFFNTSGQQQKKELQKTGAYFFLGPDGKQKMGVGVFDTATGKMRQEVIDVDGEMLSREGETPQDKEGRMIRTKQGSVRVAKEEERASALIDAGFEAAQSIPNLKRSIDLLDKIKTGGLSYAQNEAARMFGVQGGDEGELSANLGMAVLAQLRPIFGAQFTEQEGERLNKIQATFGKSAEMNRRLLSNALQIADNAAKRARRLAQSRGDVETVQEIDSQINFKLTPERKKQTPVKQQPKKSDPLGIR